MSWDCCAPSGTCQQGPGCPAGGACHQQSGCKDTACPGHPGAHAARVARVGKQHQPDALRRVLLDGGQAKSKRPWSGLTRRLLQLLGAASVVGIWALATAAADSAGPCTETHRNCTTNWESEA